LILLLILLFITPNFDREVNWEAYYENSWKYESMIKQWCKYYDLEPVWVKAIICWESNWDSEAGYGGCWGLMQVKGGSKDPYVNIKQGCKKLHDALEYFHGDLYWAFNGYNLGCGRAGEYKRQGKKWGYATKIFIIMKRIETIDLELKTRF
jgi:soluble lytic murein transglycosylase-like protein